MKRNRNFSKACWLALFFICLALPTSPAYSQRIRVLVQSARLEVLIDNVAKIKVFDGRNQKFIRVFESPLVCKSTPLGIKLNDNEIQTDLILLSSPDGVPFKVASRRYRGDLFIHKDAHFQLKLINNLNIEEYLRGIMKQEISPQWPMACLKAQAIAARSYALYEKQRNQDKLYDLKASTDSQTYLGLDGEDPQTDQAIAATSGLILTADGKPLPAFYHACCGGQTEAASDRFGDYPNLPGVRCEFCRESPYYTWQVNFTDIQIRNQLLRHRIKVGPIISLQPVSRTPSGRVHKLKIRHTLGTYIISGKKFRQLMGYDRLPSLLFQINREKTDQGNTNFSFNGGGWGHGVGLCQWGAKKMAENGADYKKILQKYYPLATITKVE